MLPALQLLLHVYLGFSEERHGRAGAGHQARTYDIVGDGVDEDLILPPPPPADPRRPLRPRDRRRGIGVRVVRGRGDASGGIGAPPIYVTPLSEEILTYGIS